MATHRILVSDKLSEDGLEVFRKAGFEVDHLPEITQEEIAECISGYDAWVVRSRSRATAEIIEKADKLRVIGRAGVGVDNVDIPAATERGVIVMNTPGGNTVSTAEHAISMLMSLSRKIPAADASMKAGKWNKKAFMGTELNDKTLGIIGLGRIGQEVCKRMKAFNMNILAYDPFVSDDRIKQLGATTATVDEICAQADFITLHTPISPETKNMINTERLATMKPTARLVNCARGGLVDEEALAKALETGEIAGAAFDVFGSEPLAEDSPLRGQPNMVLSPHIAASTAEAQENVAIQVAEQIVDVLLHEKVRNALNAPSIPPDVLKALTPYLRLGEKLGRFAAQYKSTRPVRLTCAYSGAILDHQTDPLTTAIAKGWIEPSTDKPVNYVNALPILKARGVVIREIRTTHQFRFSNLMTLIVKYEDGTEHKFSGSVFDPDFGRIVMVDDKIFSVAPTGNLVVIENKDVPGVIGRVTTCFGNWEINIAEMTWGRREKTASAMTIINVDSEVTEEMLEEIGQLPDILGVRLICM